MEIMATKKMMTGEANEERETVDERLYFVSVGRYVQFDGQGKVPEPIVNFVVQNRGEWPPYFPLPDTPVCFTLGQSQRLGWSGQGPLPEAVVDYVARNGVLPRQSAAEGVAEQEDDDSEGVPAGSYDSDGWDMQRW